MLVTDVSGTLLDKEDTQRSAYADWSLSGMVESKLTIGFCFSSCRCCGAGPA
jgi:hypothetical protein